MKYPKEDFKAAKLVASKKPYQEDRLLAALPHVKRFGHAVDVGAHIGLWVVQLAVKFNRVTCFEPHPDNYSALVENTCDLANVYPIEKALGERVEVRRLTEFGLGAHVSDIGTEIQIDRIDNIVELSVIDFLKIDVEGFEPFVIRGGETTIKRCRPVVVIEQKHDMRYGEPRCTAVDLLQKWGASIKWKMKNDYCLGW